MKKYLHDKDTIYHIKIYSSISRFTNVIKFPTNLMYSSSQNTYFEKHLRTAASDSSYILHKKLNKVTRKHDWPSVSF